MVSSNNYEVAIYDGILDWSVVMTVTNGNEDGATSSRLINKKRSKGGNRIDSEQNRFGRKIKQ